MPSSGFYIYDDWEGFTDSYLVGSGITENDVSIPKETNENHDNSDENAASTLPPGAVAGDGTQESPYVFRDTPTRHQFFEFKDGEQNLLVVSEDRSDDEMADMPRDVGITVRL